MAIAAAILLINVDVPAIIIPPEIVPQIAYITPTFPNLNIAEKIYVPITLAEREKITLILDWFGSYCLVASLSK